MRSKLSIRAQADVHQIVRRIAVDNPPAAKSLATKLRDRVRVAGRSPYLGRKLPELDREDVREAIVGNYRIVYIVRAKHVEILRIFEGHWLLPDLDVG